MARAPTMLLQVTLRARCVRRRAWLLVFDDDALRTCPDFLIEIVRNGYVPAGSGISASSCMGCHLSERSSWEKRQARRQFGAWLFLAWRVAVVDVEKHRGIGDDGLRARGVPGKDSFLEGFANRGLDPAACPI